MLTLATGENLRGVAGTGAVITYTLTGDEKGTGDSFKVLAQGQLSNVAGTLYTVPGAPVTSTLLQKILLRNTSASPVSVTLFINGTAAGNQIVGLVIPLSGSAAFAHDGWHVYDANGNQLAATNPISATGDATGTQSGNNLPLTLATVNGNVGSFGSATDTVTITADGKGRITAIAAQAIAIVQSQVSGLVAALAGKQPTGNYITALTGDVTATGPGSVGGTLATVNGNVGTFGSATDSVTVTADGKGRITAIAAVAIAIAQAQVSGLVAALAGKAATTRLINTTAPLTGGGDLSADRTLAISPATTVAAGSLSALDKLKLDNAWIDVTANTIALCTPANSAAANITAINAILAAAPAGSTIYFPGGTYNFNAAWTVPAKQFVFQGSGSGLSGGYTILAWTSNVGGDLIALQNLIWYTEFQNLTFVSSGVAQTAGSVININGNAFIKIQNCSFGAIGGGFLFNLMSGPANNASLPLSDNSWNQSIISNCIGTQYKGTAVFINSRGSSLVMENSTFNGQWGTTAQCAVAGINGKWVGAFQTTACDIIGHQNNMLFDPTAASSEVCASVHITNTYFDLSLGSCIKVAGTGATVRMKFDNCTFTTSNGGTGFSALELAGSFVYAAGGQDINLVNCNIYNTFATTGTTNGVLITNAADVTFVNVKVAGWTNGYNVTPMAGNKTNVQIIGGVVGPSGGFGGNSVGFLIAAGAYKGLQIRANNCINNTTNLTLGAVTVLAGEGSLFAITENAGINPRGVNVAPAVPATGVAATNVSGFRAMVAYKTTGTIHTAFNISGVAFAAPNLQPINTLSYFFLEPGGTVTWTGGTAPTWVWVAQ